MTKVILGFGKKEMEVVPTEGKDCRLYFVDAFTQILIRTRKEVVAIIELRHGRFAIKVAVYYHLLHRTAKVLFVIQIDTVSRRFQEETVSAWPCRAKVLHKAVALMVVVVVHNSTCYLHLAANLFRTENLKVCICCIALKRDVELEYVAKRLYEVSIVVLLVAYGRNCDISVVEVVEILQDVVVNPLPVGTCCIGRQIVASP